MKIDNSGKTIGPGPSPGGSRTTGTRPAAQGPNAGTPSAGPSSTVVSTSLNAVSGSEGAFNSQKVAEIRQAISEGRFQINPELIADGLIRSVREMLDQKGRPA